MKPMNEMSVSFLSVSSNEGFARAVVSAFAAQLDPTLDQLADLKTAVFTPSALTLLRCSITITAWASGPVCRLPG